MSSVLWGQDSGSRFLVFMAANKYLWQVNDDECNYRVNNAGGSEVSGCGGRGQVRAAVVREAVPSKWGLT